MFLYGKYLFSCVCRQRTCILTNGSEVETPHDVDSRAVPLLLGWFRLTFSSPDARRCGRDERSHNKQMLTHVGVLLHEHY